MTFVGEHIAGCRLCRELFREVLQERGSTAGKALSIGPAFWLKDEHLEYEQIVSYADQLMDSDERELYSEHLGLCGRCREDFESFLAHRRETEWELSTRYGPAVPAVRGVAMAPRWVGGLWGRLAAAALILLALGLAWFVGGFRREPETSIADKAPGVGASEPIGTVRRDPPPEPRPKDSPSIAASTAPHSPAGRQLELGDRGRRIVLDRSGNLEGLEGVSGRELATVKDALLAEDIPLPAVLSDLQGSEGSLRGEGRTAFRLVGPRREVVLAARPTFRWQAVKDAISYSVYVVPKNLGRKNSGAIISSPKLSAGVTEWRPDASFARGGVYSWSVSATVHGEEVISPAPADPEMKFRILGDEELRAVTRLQKLTNSHLARGVVYARAGLVSEAERELSELMKENAGSREVRKLLDRVRSWR